MPWPLAALSLLLKEGHEKGPGGRQCALPRASLTSRLRSRLRERHQDVLRQKLYKLKQEQGVESEPLFPILKPEPRSPSCR